MVKDMDMGGIRLASFRRSRGMPPVLSFPMHSVRVVRLGLASPSDSIRLVRQTALRDLPVCEAEELHHGRLDALPLPPGQVCVLGKQCVVRRQTFACGAPHRNQQQQICAMFQRA